MLQQSARGVMGQVGFVFLTSYFASSLALAATPPPTTPTPLSADETVFQSSSLTEMTMGRLQLRFEKTSLDEVRAAASAGTIAHQGDAGASIYWLCYTNLNSASERIWVVSDGEMGGNEHRVTGVIARRLPSLHATNDCPSMPASLAPLKLENGIWLDTPPQTARKVLGAVSSKMGNWESYDYMGKVPGDCAGAPLDLTSSIMLEVVKKQIHSLRVTRITSC